MGKTRVVKRALPESKLARPVTVKGPVRKALPETKYEPPRKETRKMKRAM